MACDEGSRPASGSPGAGTGNRGPGKAGVRDPGSGVREKRGVRSYRDLRVWQHAIQLVPPVYRLLRKLPKEEIYALADQIRRAAVSIPANIAEGHARQHTREFLQHLSIARGSLAELETLLIIAEKLGYLSQSDLQTIEDRMRTVGMLLHGLTRRLRADPGPRIPDPAHGLPEANREP